MRDCKAVASPLKSRLNYKALSVAKNYNALCRNLLGCLRNGMVCTSPDLSAAANILSRYMNYEIVWREY